MSKIPQDDDDTLGGIIGSHSKDNHALVNIESSMMAIFIICTDAPGKGINIDELS